MADPFTVDVFQCRGSSYEVGRCLAEGYRRAGKALALGLQDVPRISEFVFEDARSAVRAFAPNLWDELRGIADGLSLPFMDTVAAFSNGRLAYPQRGCSAVMDGRLYGRNYDFSPARYDRALVALQADGCHAHVGFADRLTGRLDGTNEPGLAVGLHYVNEAGWRPGLGPILIVRILLDQCATTGQAIALLRRLPHGLAFCYSLLDAEGSAAVVEAAPEGVAVHEGAHLACTNHFRSPALQNANRASIRQSQRRLPVLEAWAQAGLSAETLFSIMNAAGSPAFQHDYAGASGTLHTLVCEPAEGRMTVGIGADAQPRSLDLRAWAGGAALDFDRLAGRLDVLAERAFVGRDLSGALFRDVSLRQARFDEVDLDGAEIESTCSIDGMKIAGVAVEELLAAYRKRNGRAE